MGKAETKMHRWVNEHILILKSFFSFLASQLLNFYGAAHKAFLLLTTLAIISLIIFLAPAGEAAPPGTAGGWKQAIGPWQWSFPRDHGAHPEFRTEWWYFTGNLKDKDGKQYGYQLTFFRQGLALKASQPTNPWSIRDVYLAHFAIVDGSSGTILVS